MILSEPSGSFSTCWLRSMFQRKATPAIPRMRSNGGRGSESSLLLAVQPALGNSSLSVSCSKLYSQCSCIASISTLCKSLET